MFQKGEYVVYGAKGVCQIKDVSHVDIPGADKNRLYYIMRPIQSNSGTVYLPIDSNRAVIRKVMTPDEANDLISDIPVIEQLCVSDEKKREDSYKEAMRSCSGRAWVSILKALYLRKRERTAAGKKVTALDERYLRVVEQELYGELSIVLGIPRDEVEQYICNCLGKQP